LLLRHGLDSSARARDAENLAVASTSRRVFEVQNLPMESVCDKGTCPTRYREA